MMALTNAVERIVKKMRAENRLIPASMISAWKTFLGVVGSIMVVSFYFNEPSPYIFWAKVGMVVIAIATWLSEAYFIRKHWELIK